MLTSEEKDFLDALYRKYEQKLFWISYEILGRRPDNRQLAEDCVQQTFETAMRKYTNLKRSPVPYFWLRKTCQNVSNRSAKTGKTEQDSEQPGFLRRILQRPQSPG